MAPGAHMAGRSDSSQNSPSWASGTPSRKLAKMARRASTYSRRRGPGRSNSLPYRRSMWARTCVPNPRRNRPSDSSASSQATWAVTIGLRGKATATPVRISSSVASAATAHER